MKIPELVLFDFGGVLIDYPHQFITALKELGTNTKSFDKGFDDHVDELTLGRMSPQELYKLVLFEQNFLFNPDYDFLTAWVKDYSRIEPTFELVVKLSNITKVGILSNI